MKQIALLISAILIPLIFYACSPGLPTTYTVVYDSNGATSGTVPDDTNDYEDGDTVTVLGNTGNLQKPGYEFSGWNASADRSGAEYIEGATFVIGAFDVTLYAQWTQSTTNPIPSITEFGFRDLSVTGSIDETNYTIAVTVPYGTDVTALVPTITHTGSSVSPASDAVQDFTNPVTYTVTAADNSTQDYVVTVTVALITKSELIQKIQNGDDVTTVDTSGITDMNSLFQDETDFNQDISNWDVSNVTDMGYMFHNASSFNQDLSVWDVSNNYSMAGMFRDASAFNGNISSWNVGNVTHMDDMFQGASSFNQDLSVWDVSSVTDMSYMFSSAITFNQNISGWSVYIPESLPHDGFSGNCPLTTANHPYESWNN